MEKIKSLQQCKDEVVSHIMIGNNAMYYDSWQSFEEDMSRMDFGDEYAKAWESAAELYASKSNKSDSVNMDVEKAAEDFACRENGGSSGSGIMQYGFKEGAKWQSEQPLVISWFSDEEISNYWRNKYHYHHDIYFNSLIEGSKYIQLELRNRVKSISAVEWVSIEEKMPENNDIQVLVTGGNYITSTIMTGAYLHYILNNKGTTSLIPTHWMKIPPLSN